MPNVYQKYDWQKDRSIGWTLGPKEGGQSNNDRLGRIIMNWEV